MSPFPKMALLGSREDHRKQCGEWGEPFHKILHIHTFVVFDLLRFKHDFLHLL